MINMNFLEAYRLWALDRGKMFDIGCNMNSIVGPLVTQMAMGKTFSKEDYFEYYDERYRQFMSNSKH